MHALEQMTRVPGVVLAHDARLLTLYKELHRHRHLYDPYWLENKLAEMYGERLPMAELRRIPYEGARAEARVGMTGEVQSSAERVLVHSRYQRELLRLDRPAAAAPTEVVPFAIPPIEPARDGASPDAPLVLAVGPVRPELAAAVERLSASHPGARLLDGDSGAGGELRSADLAVYLPSGAESGRPAGAVGALIAARVPTIVSDVGWAGELPEGVVIPVAADCTAEMLAEAMRSTLDDERRRAIRQAQEAYAEENSFARVAERYAELLSL